MCIKLPGAVYGKNLTSPGKIARNFHWMKRHHEFPDAIFSLSDQWCQRFQWMSVDEGRHKPVALWIPVSGAPGGALLLHFADAGLDDKGRPGTLSLEAGWASEDAIQQHPKLREYFLVQAVRAESFMSDAEEPMICIQLDSNIAELSRALSGKASNTSIMASSSAHGFSMRGKEDLLFLDANTWQENKESADSNKSLKGPSSTILTEQKQSLQNFIPIWTPQKKHPWGWLSVVVLLGMLLTFSGYILWDQHRGIDELIREKNALTGKYSDRIKENNNLINTLNEEKVLRNEVEAKYNELQAEVEVLREKLARKEKEIDMMRQNLTHATKQQIQDLNDRNEECFGMINKIKEILSVK